MSAHTKVINLTTGCKIKRSQAIGRVGQCISAWVNQGFSIRDLSLQESIEARNRQAKDREPLPLSEIQGLIFQPAMKDVSSNRESCRLAYEAGKFAAMGA